MTALIVNHGAAGNANRVRRPSHTLSRHALALSSSVTPVIGQACLGMSCRPDGQGFLELGFGNAQRHGTEPSGVARLANPGFLHQAPNDPDGIRGDLAGRASASMTNSDVMYPRLGVAVSGREDKLTRSSLLPNHLLPMSLTCIPKPCSCGVKLPVHGVGKGFTHPKQAPCPFSVQDFPKKRFGTCCSLQSSIAYWHLIAFGEDLLAARLDCPMTVEQASAFAETLRQAMNRLEERYRQGHPKPEGARNLTYWRKNRTEFVWHRRSTFEEAVAAVRLAAAWFELVSRLGYGVAVK